jgi:hypothetical protein
MVIDQVTLIQSLRDDTIYQQLTDAEATKAIKDLDESIETWIEDFEKVLD